MRRLFIIIMILISVMACRNSRPPKDIIRKEVLVPLLIDMHMVYSVQTSMEFREMVRKADSVDIHSYVFEKHGMDKAIFDSTIAWYSRHPDLFTEVYDEVVMQLTRLRDSINPNYEE